MSPITMDKYKPQVNVIRREGQKLSLPNNFHPTTKANPNRLLIADFLAQKALQFYTDNVDNLVILDPDAESSIILNAFLDKVDSESVEVIGVHPSAKGLSVIRDNLLTPKTLDLIPGDFLNKYRDFYGEADIVICVPPYIRTKDLDKEAVEAIFEEAGIELHYDSFQAYVLASLQCIREGGIGVFLLPSSLNSTRAYKDLRRLLSHDYNVVGLWDLGDLNLVERKMNPTILVVKKEYGRGFAEGVSLYSLNADETGDELPTDPDLLSLLSLTTSPLEVVEGHVNLKEPFWVVRSSDDDAFKEDMEAVSESRFADHFWMHPGIITQADPIFIKHQWDFESPFLKPIQTKLVGSSLHNPFHGDGYKVLYPYHEDGTLANLDDCKHMGAYFRQHFNTLSSRFACRVQQKIEWYEPVASFSNLSWSSPKIVWKGLQRYPAFWIDDAGSIVNNDMYWMIPKEGEPDELLWLSLGLLNSSALFEYYNLTFNSRCQNGMRRFLIQYVLGFPMPPLDAPEVSKIVSLMRTAFLVNSSGIGYVDFNEELDGLVDSLFGL